MPTTTLDLEQSAPAVWACLVDPAAVMWLTPKAAFALAPPERLDGFGELRCCWQDRWRKGIRSSTVWELKQDPEAGRVVYRDRSNPTSDHTITFTLRTTDSGTSVDIIEYQDAPWRDRLDPLRSDQTSVVRLEQRFLEAVSGNVPVPTDPQILTWSPGAGSHEQVNQIDITAPSKVIWSLIDPGGASRMPVPSQLASWKAAAGGVDYRCDVSRLPSGGVAFELLKVTHTGRYRATTIDTRGVQVEYALLPDEQSWLLRTTHRWTIAVKAGHIRDDARGWLARVKVTAESEAGPPPAADQEPVS